MGQRNAAMATDHDSLIGRLSGCNSSIRVFDDANFSTRIHGSVCGGIDGAHSDGGVINCDGDAGGAAEETVCEEGKNTGGKQLEGNKVSYSANRVISQPYLAA